MPAVQAAAVFAMTLYGVPVCPWKLQVAPFTDPQSLPSCGGTPLLTAAAEAVADTPAAMSVRSERRLTRLNRCVLFVI
jgi:hypothetical protein